ncbi:MAG: folate family ECF transporter S component [Clostridiales bacterium]|jgi:ECF transporter S component (folate family)|nr:folate family ECF transporter S component [Clostridiales bacterium]
MSNIMIKRLMLVALLVAIEVALSRFLFFELSTLRFGFEFLPIALVGMLFGPIWAASAGVAADILGYAMLPAIPYFPGFTAASLLAGAIYGMLLHNKDSWICTIAAVGIVCLPLSLGLEALWLHMTAGANFFADLQERISRCLIIVPIQIIVTRCMSYFVHLRISEVNPSV